MGMPVGTPLSWHRRVAMTLASQMPEESADAQLVMIALQDLMDNFMGKAPQEEQPQKSGNVLPFGSASG